MGARKQLADAIAAKLPDDIRVIDHSREIDSIEGGTRAVIQVYRRSVKPAANAMGALTQSFELFVIEPSTEPGISEDALDDTTDEVIEILAGLEWLIWSEATRATFDKRYPAYQFEIEASTKITKEQDQ